MRKRRVCDHRNFWELFVLDEPHTTNESRSIAGSVTYRVESSPRRKAPTIWLNGAINNSRLMNPKQKWNIKEKSSEQVVRKLDINGNQNEWDIPRSWPDNNQLRYCL